MMAIPLADDSVDVIICMEALEHSTDFTRTLDELVRVLEPEGLLFVSSPNPAVYPEGNPFHIHELDPSRISLKQCSLGSNMWRSIASTRSSPRSCSRIR